MANEHDETTNKLVSATMRDAAVPDVDAELQKRADEIAGPWTVADFAKDYSAKRAALDEARVALRAAQAALTTAELEAEGARISLANAKAAES